MAGQTLAGKVAIVTGGTRGIGAATVLELARRGAKVAFTFVSDSSAQLAEELVKSVQNLGNGSAATAVQADMGSVEATAKIVSETTAAYGDTIDILVHNAGVPSHTRLTEITNKEYDRVLNVNVRGVILLTQAVVPHLPKAGGGRIINVGSIAARRPVAHSTLYSASKAALEALTRVWATELGASGHTANVVAPGPTATDMIAGSEDNELLQQFMEASKSATPMQNRLGTSEDIALAIATIALAIATIAEPSARWITGQSISASGGLAMF